MNILQTTFLFFAQYPLHAGVMKNFNKSTSTQEYNDLKTLAQNIPVKDRIPQLTDYVFGVSDEAVKKRIQSISGVYLFVDYGDIRTTTNSLNVKKEEFDISVTVARPFSSNTFDAMEEIVMVDSYLQILADIRKDMRENRDDPFVRLLTFPTDITPFASAQLNNSYGFSMVFQIQGVELI